MVRKVDCTVMRLYCNTVIATGNCWCYIKIFMVFVFKNKNDVKVKYVRDVRRNFGVKHSGAIHNHRRCSLLRQKMVTVGYLLN